MNKLPLLIILLSVCLTISGQTISQQNNCYRGNDVLKKKQVTVKGFCLSDTKGVWNLEEAELSEESYDAEYSTETDTLMAVERSNRTYYSQDRGAVSIIGTENYMELMSYDMPETWIKFPMQVGDSVSGYFNASGSYCDRFFMRRYGTYMTKADALGKLVLPQGDTLKNVIRLHTERYVGTIIVPIDTMQYRIPGFTVDSIVRHLAPDTAKVREDEYRWYAEGYRYPILEAKTTSYCDSMMTAVPTDYCGNMIYENGVLKQILVDGGYMTVTGTPFYFYYLKDHLGNNRVVISPAGTATQINHYYPFGGLFGESTGSTGQRYKYNGKEFDRTHGLDWYDYGARHMSPDVGRFTTIDPMAEKYYSISPYAYCGNNPVNAIDPDGKSTWVKALEDGTYQVIGGDIDDDDRNIYLYNQDSNGDYTVKGEAIGVTSSTTSFYNSDKNEWRNSIINPSDISGKVFLGKIFKDPNIISYMDKARKDNEYDFKVTNGTPGKKDLDIYRGMPIGQTKEGMTIYTSARDIGNIAAGYVAAVNGLTWGLARLGFDFYQKGIEGVSTQNAQYYGWRYGRKSMPFGKQRFNSSDPYIIP